MKRATLIGLAMLVTLTATGASRAGEIGYSEDFALAPDRAAALKQLIPGTEDYYYYHCLHYQTTGQAGELGKMLKLWIKRNGRTSRVREIEHRQALLDYEKNPNGTLGYLTKHLGLQFNHQREILGRKPSLPTKLEAKLISRATLTARALARHTGTVDGFEPVAYDWLISQNIGGDRIRHLLGKLTRPDVANLPRIVVDDLNRKYSRGFGSMGIHRALLQDQLDACLEMKPDLLAQTNFVTTYLSKLRPNPDEDWQYDAAVRRAHLDRLWEFARTLPPVHNSIKAHVLYQRLVLDRSQGVFDKDRFMTYIKLPRSVSYINPKYISTTEQRRYMVNLGSNYQAVTMLGPIGNDEALVRSFLQHFFVEEASWKPYETYIRDTYLKPLFAETKIVHGIGDMEQWYSMLSPSAYRALKERVDIDFAATNKLIFGADEPVSLDVFVKNAGDTGLFVKVYEINAFNYYRDAGRDVNTDINLDGLVANEEKVHKYKEVDLRRVRRTFTFPSLTKRGVYVVDFIGNGKSSRALIRKGQLRFHVRNSVAGHVFTVYDDAHKKVPTAAIWLAGHKYTADEDGEITIPYTNKPTTQSIILTDGAFAQRTSFNHLGENYALQAGIYVDREALLTRKKVQVMVRPMLSINGEPVTLAVLTDVALVLSSVDQDGVATTKEVKDFKLFEDREATYELRVPERLRRISFTLKAKVKNQALNKKIDLADSATYSLNGIDATIQVEDMHLLHADGRYTLEVLGKGGERRADRPIHFTLKHRDFRETVQVSLKSDPNGRIDLGALTDIDSVHVQTRGEGGSNAWQRRWTLVKDRAALRRAVNGRAGEALYIPYMGQRKQADRSELSLLELRGGTFRKDCFDSLKIRNGFIVIEDLPAGDYSLLVKRSNTTINVKLAAGEKKGADVVNVKRWLEVRNARPLQVESVTADKDNVTIRLQNATKFARVHVVATRYLPAYSLYDRMVTGFVEPGAAELGRTLSIYMAGRKIGDEYRYILERKYATKFPGNMLKRPGLLLNPWAIRKTDAGEQRAREGGAFGRGYGGKAGSAPGRGLSRPSSKVQADNLPNLDFLRDPAAVLINLTPDANGVVTVPLADMGPHHHVHVLAVDPENTVFRQITLAEVDVESAELRLPKALDPKQHFTEQKQISILGKGKTLVLADITSSKQESYDSLAKVYALYVTLSGNATLREFGFIVKWPTLKDEEKRKLYSKYACHELNFFLFRRDPDFFRKVVQPYLRNKKDKTYLDHWLVGNDLAGYVKPWAYGQLNIVERVLLAQRLDAERKLTPRHVKDLFDLIPPDITRFNHLFATAIQGRALEAGGERDEMMEAVEMEEAKLVDKLVTTADRSLALRRSGLAEAAPTPAKPSAPMEKQAEAKRSLKEDAAKGKKRASATPPPARGAADGKADYYHKDLAKLEDVRQLYRKLDKTQEWVENNYYHLPIEQQNASLVTVNGFWLDYAKHDGDGPFFSANFAEASRSFAEMMLALAVLDLPFDPAEHEREFEGRTFTMKAGSPMVVFHREIRSAAAAADKTPILVSQNFFRHGDRYRHVNNVKLDKYVTEEFLPHVVYGCQVVITNPTSSRQELDVLVQIPEGAIPVANGKYTRSSHIDLQPYHTQTLEYYFYFPAPQDWPHYPVHVSRHGDLIASAEPVTLHVVAELSKIDKTSWDYLSQNGSDAETIDFLKQQNLGRVDLTRIAWRVKDAGFFRRALAVLLERHAYNQVLWSYGVKHNAPAAIREYLQHQGSFVSQCGMYLDSVLLTIDPVLRKTYQIMEYDPLVNARAHKLGNKREIVNERFRQQYLRLMKVLTYRRELDDDDLMSVTYYMLLQGRVEEAIGFFARVDEGKLDTRLQHDYFRAYLDFFNEAPKLARQIATGYKDHPVDKWRKRFLDVLNQLDEVEGKAAKVVDDKDRTQKQTALAASEPGFDLKVEAGTVTLDYQNLAGCTVNYYEMDIELLFSRNPFVQSGSAGGQFSYIRPNATATIKLDPKGRTHEFKLPKQFLDTNVLVEIVSGGVKKSKAYYSNSLALQVIEMYGQVKVAHAKTGKPLPKVYVKVYARMKDGGVRFYKDGYTDIRGRFDYVSLNTNELDNVAQFSLLVLSEDHGAVIREAAPPKR